MAVTNDKLIVGVRLMKRRMFLAGASAMAAAPMLAKAQTTGAPSVPIAAHKMERIAFASSTFRAQFDGWQYSVPEASPRLSMLTLPAYVRDTFGVRKLELWGRQFGERGHTEEHYRAIRAAADAAGVSIINLQVEDLGSLNQADQTARDKILADAKVWLDKAKILGATSIRINVTRDTGPIDFNAVVATLRQMADYGQSIGVRVLLENHGGYTQSIPNLIGLVQAVNHDFCKITIDWGAWAPPGDRYEAMQSAMPLNHLVSAKGTVFDETTYVHSAFDVPKLAANAESGGFRGVYSIELWNNPAPKNTLLAAWSHIRAITGAMA